MKEDPTAPLREGTWRHPFRDPSPRLTLSALPRPWESVGERKWEWDAGGLRAGWGGSSEGLSPGWGLSRSWGPSLERLKPAAAVSRPLPCCPRSPALTCRPSLHKAVTDVEEGLESRSVSVLGSTCLERSLVCSTLSVGGWPCLLGRETPAPSWSAAPPPPGTLLAAPGLTARGP